MTPTSTQFRHLTTLISLLCALTFAACGDGTGQDLPSEQLPISTGPEIPAEDLCGQEYSVCGYVHVPSNFEGTVKSIAVALYREVPPRGSPDVLITQIDSPSMFGGELYPIRAYPFLDTGEYKLYIIVYMEGGGSARPANEIDYTGYIPESFIFDGQPIEFGEITLERASGW